MGYFIFRHLFSLAIVEERSYLTLAMLGENHEHGPDVHEVSLAIFVCASAANNRAAIESMPLQDRPAMQLQ